jgi:hypothetical protein
MVLPSWGISSGPSGALGTLYMGLGPLGGDVGYIAAGGSNAAAKSAITYSPSVAPNPTPVTPTFDPKIEANALYGKPMALYTGGYARIGASPAPIVGPYIHDGVVDFIVSFGVPSNPEGTRRIYKIYLDNELAWSSAGGGTLPGDGTFASEPFDFIFKTGRLDQTACSLETIKFPGDECAYRPQMLLQITGIPYKRFMDVTGKPVPYVACDIGDVTDGADPLDGINLGEALERIAFSPWAGYTSASFAAVNITDVVDAILIKDNFTVIQLCQSVTGEYRNLDLLCSDKVWIKDRGPNVTPNFIFDRNSIISGDGALSVIRADATTQRREHELVAIDPDQDYTAVPSLAKIPRDPMVISAAVGKETSTLPLVINADTRQALATFSQNYQENARRKVAFKVLGSGYQIEPGDLFALNNIANGFDNEVFKCTQTTHGANWVVDLEGEAILRCSIYTSPPQSPGIVFVSTATNYARYAAVSNDTTDQQWWGYWIPDGYSVLGSIPAMSYGMAAGRPTFVTGGRLFFDGIITISHDGMVWENVWIESGQYVADLVWNAADQMFYANTPSNCWSSPDGHSWTQIGGDFWSHVPSGFADGHSGYDAVNDHRILPADLVLDFMHVNCTAFADGVWMAGGYLLSNNDSATATSIDGGVTWVLVASGLTPAGPDSPGAAGNVPVTRMVAAPRADMGLV